MRSECELVISCVSNGISSPVTSAGSGFTALVEWLCGSVTRVLVAPQSSNVSITSSQLAVVWWCVPGVSFCGNAVVVVVVSW